MIKPISCHSLSGVLSASNPFAGGVPAMLLALCLWLVPAVLPVNAASPGTVVAWGENTYGQRTVPAGLDGVVAIAAGAGHALALKNDGTIVAWGEELSTSAKLWFLRV